MAQMIAAADVGVDEDDEDLMRMIKDIIRRKMLLPRTAWLGQT